MKDFLSHALITPSTEPTVPPDQGQPTALCCLHGCNLCHGKPLAAILSHGVSTFHVLSRGTTHLGTFLGRSAP